MTLTDYHLVTYMCTALLLFFCLFSDAVVKIPTVHVWYCNCQDPQEYGPQMRTDLLHTTSCKFKEEVEFMEAAADRGLFPPLPSFMTSVALDSPEGFLQTLVSLVKVTLGNISHSVEDNTGIKTYCVHSQSSLYWTSTQLTSDYQTRPNYLIHLATGFQNNNVRKKKNFILFYLSV